MKIDTTTFVVLIVLAVVVAILAPFGTIWAINTLFATKIAYTFWTWLAMFWLQGFFISMKASK
jgi:hypothetical protein